MRRLRGHLSRWLCSLRNPSHLFENSSLLSRASRIPLQESTSIFTTISSTTRRMLVTR
ncbi:unnamed protein product [Gongylonema pulchrum]|uniref:Uncharacterized protein n=1 Tax=Gongylonema pulchrum TaxID=637853 RepID=A0A183DDP3_9BILA|nr:unnamed protein product [Gongylonema pulchrum]